MMCFLYEVGSPLICCFLKVFFTTELIHLRYLYFLSIVWVKVATWELKQGGQPNNLYFIHSGHKKHISVYQISDATALMPLSTKKK